MTNPAVENIRNTVGQAAKPVFDVVKATALMARIFVEQTWLVAGLLTYGLTLLAGKPKIGKSWLVMELAICVARGTKFLEMDTTRADVLVVSLEDGARRMRRRLEAIGVDGAVEGLDFVFDLPKTKGKAGVFDAVKDHLDKNPGCKLVVIDTLGRIREQDDKTDGNSYGADTDFLARFQRLAVEREVAMVIIHHVRKSKANDVFDTMSGTTGLTGAADILMVLDGKRGENVKSLHITGRDIEDKVLAMEMENCVWRLADASSIPSGPALTPERRKVLDAITGSAAPLGATEIAEAIGLLRTSVSNMLNKLCDDGLVVKVGTGKYAVPQSGGATAVLPPTVIGVEPVVDATAEPAVKAEAEIDAEATLDQAVKSDAESSVEAGIEADVKAAAEAVAERVVEGGSEAGAKAGTEATGVAAGAEAEANAKDSIEATPEDAGVPIAEAAVQAGDWSASQPAIGF